MAIYRLGELTPQVAASAYVADEAVVIGNVTLGERVTVLPGAVIRGDNDSISVADDSNLQDGAVLHADPGYPLKVGAAVTVGHQAMLHGCTIGDGSLVGIQAVIMNGAVIGAECLIGAGAIIPEGKRFADRSLILGAPARLRRELGDEDIDGLRAAAASYVERGALYRRDLKRLD